MKCTVCRGKGDIFVGKPCWRCGKYAESLYADVQGASSSESVPRDSGSSGNILSTQVAGEHYKYLTPQPIEVIEAWGIGFHLGAAIKYIARAGKKPGNSAKQDIEKAVWFLRRYCEISGEGRYGGVDTGIPS